MTTMGAPPGRTPVAATNCRLSYSAWNSAVLTISRRSNQVDLRPISYDSTDSGSKISRASSGVAGTAGWNPPLLKPSAYEA
jgi:hypothetical protein